MKNITRAISIRQPFAELILLGKKKYEYRSIPTSIRERVYIYASLQRGGEDSDLVKAGKSFEKLNKGVIVGSVEIVDCLRQGKGVYAYKLANPKRVKRLVKPTNQPSPVFWRPKF